LRAYPSALKIETTPSGENVNIYQTGRRHI
jgi:hypothetical protein